MASAGAAARLIAETCVTTNAAASTSAYRVIRGDVARDRSLVLELWRNAGLRDASEEDGGARYDWFYLRGPAGPADVFFLEHVATGATVGAIGLARRHFWYRGRRVTAGVPVDFIVHPAHRVLFPALLLVRSASEWGMKAHALVLGYPNRNSAAAMKRTGHYLELPQARYTRILDFRAFLARYAPRYVAAPVGAVINLADRVADALRGLAGRGLPTRWADGFDARYDALWDRAMPGHDAIGWRDRRFLEWRFAVRPSTAWRVLEVLDADGAALLGYFVCEPDGRRGLTVVDFLAPPDPRLQRAALRALAQAARAVDAAGVSLVVTRQHPFAEALRASKFLKREGSFSLVSSPPGDSQTLGSEFWHVTPADFDA